MNLTDSQVENFEDDGYLFLPDAFTLEDVAVLYAEVPGIFAQERPEVWREKGTRSVRTAFAAHTYNEAFRRLAHHPRLIGPVMRLLGGPVYVHQFKINGKAAFDGDVWQWHQDYGTWARDDLMPEPRAMNVALFLDDVTEFNGALMIIPKSHKQGVLEAGHDLSTTSYPLWTLDKDEIARLVDEGGLVAPKGRGGVDVDVPLQPGARLARQHLSVQPHHRLHQRLSRRQPHPPLQARGMDRPPRLHADRVSRRRLPVGTGVPRTHG